MFGEILIQNVQGDARKIIFDRIKVRKSNERIENGIEKKNEQSVNRDSTKLSFPVKPFSNVDCKDKHCTVSGVRSVNDDRRQRYRIPKGSANNYLLIYS